MHSFYFLAKWILGMQVKGSEKFCKLGKGIPEKQKEHQLFVPGDLKDP